MMTVWSVEVRQFHIEQEIRWATYAVPHPSHARNQPNGQGL